MSMLGDFGGVGSRGLAWRLYTRSLLRLLEPPARTPLSCLHGFDIPPLQLFDLPTFEPTSRPPATPHSHHCNSSIVKTSVWISVKAVSGPLDAETLVQMFAEQVLQVAEHRSWLSQHELVRPTEQHDFHGSKHVATCSIWVMILGLFFRDW